MMKKKIELLNVAKSARLMLRRLLNTYTRRWAINQYLKSHQIRKLQIGNGSNILYGWLNTDIFPTSNQIIFLDVRQRFPFSDCTFDYVFSEHLIEHLPYKEGIFMLRECYRVLKPGGKLRTATPDLRFLIELWGPEKTEVQKQYIQWAVDTFLSEIGIYQAAFVINNFFRAWGHEFIYDLTTLQGTLEEVGFVNPVYYEPGESDDKELQCLESHQKVIPDQFNRLETMVIEAIRPAYEDSFKLSKRKNESV